MKNTNKTKHERYFFIFLTLGILLFSVSGLSDEELVYVPVNTILLYHGSINDFDVWGNLINDSSWHLCNGINGTPDMQKKFVVGFDFEENDYDVIGETGGEKEHTLTINEMPYHEHNYDDIYHIINRRNLANGVLDNAEGYSMYGMSGTTTGVGGSEPHENRPPYYVVMYIIRVS